MRIYLVFNYVGALNYQTKLFTQKTFGREKVKERERLSEQNKERQQEAEKQHTQTIQDVTRLVILQWITSKTPKQNASLTTPDPTSCEKQATA